MAKSKVRNPQTFKEYLHNQTVDELRKLARHLPITLPSGKEGIVDAIFHGMMDDSNLQGVWLRLDELQRAAVAEVVHGGAKRFDASAFRAKYGADPNWGTADKRWMGITTPSLLGLFFFDQVIPNDLKEALRPIAPKPLGVSIKTVVTLPSQVALTQRSWQRRQGVEAAQVELIDRDTQLMAQNDLVALLRLVEAGEVRITAKTLRPTAATLRLLAGHLDGGDFFPPPDPEKQKDYTEPTTPEIMRAFAWPLLLQSAELALAVGNKLQLTDAGKKALLTPPHETLRKIWQRWLKNTQFDEFNRIRTIKGQTGKGQDDMTAPAPRRKVIAEALATLPVNQWIEFSELSRYMQATGYTFTISRDLWTLYVEDPNYGSLGYQGFGEWHIVQARYLLVFLMEYAATLGLIDIAYIPPANARWDFGNLWGVDDLDCLSDYDGLRYLRLNDLGAWVLGQTNLYQAPVITAQAIFTVLPNHDIVTSQRIAASDGLMLERFAQKTAEHVWHIDPLKLLEAHEAGLSLQEIQSFLTTKSHVALPQTVARLLEETTAKAAALTALEAAHLIKVGDPQTARLIASESRLAKYCLLAGDDQIVVPAKSLSAFRRVLHELGYALPQQV